MIGISSQIGRILLMDHLGPLRDYIHSQLHVVKVFPDTAEIWEKKTE